MSKLSTAALYHRQKRRQLLADDPTLAALSGEYPWSLAWIAALGALHFGIAWLVRDGGVFVVFGAAFFVGQLILHGGGALVHDAAHGLILKRRRLLVDVALEILLTSFGHHAQYQLDHIVSHHPYLGDYQRDYEHKDACRFRLRQRLRSDRPVVHRSLIALQLLLDLLPLGFLVSDDLVAAIERRSSELGAFDHGRSVPDIRISARRRSILLAVSAAVLLVVGVGLGPWSLLYCVWSLSIFQGRMGITNVGQVLSEHPDGDVVTRSTYGAWNYLFFNTGYHDEHHTFPNVAWVRLPQLKRRVPAAFSANERGYVRWWYEYVFAQASRRPRQSIPDERCSKVTRRSLER